jgi:hypothetical protein
MGTCCYGAAEQTGSSSKPAAGIAAASSTRQKQHEAALFLHKNKTWSWFMRQTELCPKKAAIKAGS